MKNKKGQSLIEIVFSIGIVVLVLTGVAMLIVGTNRAKRESTEREKAIELSQKLVENTVLEIKNNSFVFWKKVNDLDGQTILNNKGSDLDTNFNDYLYDIKYENCNIDSCNIVFNIKWECLSNICQKNLSVERLFSKLGI